MNEPVKYHPDPELGEIAEFTFTDEFTAEATLPGVGKASAATSKYFFEMLAADGIPTHFITADIPNGTMRCRKLHMIPLIYVWRYKAMGTFCNVYNVDEGTELNGIIETLVDMPENPRICDETSVALGLITSYRQRLCYEYMRRISTLFTTAVTACGLELIDFRIEFGMDAEDGGFGTLRVGGEISGLTMTVVHKDGKLVDPVRLASLLITNEPAKEPAKEVATETAKEEAAVPPLQNDTPSA